MDFKDFREWSQYFVFLTDEAFPKFWIKSRPGAGFKNLGERRLAFFIGARRILAFRLFCFDVKNEKSGDFKSDGGVIDVKIIL